MSTDVMTGPACACGCGCAEPAGTPAPIANRAGLRSVSYRAGTWAEFRAAMLDALSTKPELAGLRTRDPDDFTIALIDAWAVVCDILTFYSERIANEAFIRTATERISVGELAKLIGYKLRPGLAASVALAFTLETIPPGVPGPNTPPLGLPASIVLPVGTKGQTIPDPGAQPATFETTVPTMVRADWNAIPVRQTRPIAADCDNAYSDIRLAGVATGVKAGDWILVDDATGCRSLNQVRTLQTDTATQTTQVGFDFGVPVVSVPDPTAQGAAGPQDAPDDAFVWSSVRGRVWDDQGDLVAYALARKWSLDELERQINALRGQSAPDAQPPRLIYTMAAPAGFFGNTAMDYQVAKHTPNNPYTADWEKATLATGVDQGNQSFDLDAVYPAVAGQPLVLVDGDSTHFTTVAAVQDHTRSDYYVTARTTRIWMADRPDTPEAFGLRTTQVFLPAGELHELDMLDTGVVADGKVALDGAHLSLRPGRLVTVTGVRADRSGQTDSEVATVKKVRLVDGYTSLEIAPALTGRYVRGSVRINANTAAATHGESTSEILGNGDASAAFLRFALRQPPLTHVSAATAAGSASTLTVRVDGVAWTEVPWLAGAGPNDRVYTVVAAVDGLTYVQFGDGAAGARPGSGVNNVVAEYRHGTGSAGRARAGQISTLLTRPMGLKAVANPVPSTGAADPEQVGEARTNAPVTVKTLDRIVSREDVADFAAAGAGIAKAATSWIWDGTRDVACVTVAGTGGAEVPPGGAQYDNLLTAMREASDGTLAVTLCSYVPVTFTVAATLTTDPSLVRADVLAAVRTALAAAFSFAARAFAQPVFASEIVAVVQGVPGVVALTLDGLARKGDPLTPVPDFLPAAPPTAGAAGPVGAELLMLETGSLLGVVLT